MLAMVVLLSLALVDEPGEQVEHLLGGQLRHDLACFFVHDAGDLSAGALVPVNPDVQAVCRMSGRNRVGEICVLDSRRALLL
jgi:hypothetical protein